MASLCGIKLVSGVGIFLVAPVISRTSNFLAIDPDDCIDCTLCVAECPVEAIFAEEDMPPDQRSFTSLNVELARNWPPIIATKPALPDADEWATVKEKLCLLER